MVRKFNLFTLTLFACLVLQTQITAQTLVPVTDADLTAESDVTWTAGNEYVLNGLVFLETGGKLTIEAGTVIRGAAQGNITNGDLASTLIISRGAQIFANGTAEAPIIFTAESDDLNSPDDLEARDRQLWGGLIILGSATIASPGGQNNIEGIKATEDRTEYGGTDDDDNSGVLNYVSIRHGGAALAPGDEINGLTLGGVGSGTTIDYVEVYANFDDGIEWFGGTVKVNHAATAFCGDDGFDYDLGWRGGGQYWFSLQSGAQNTGRAGEHDGADPDGQAPFSNPTIVNATYVGIGQDAVAVGGEAGDGNNDGLAYAVYFRDNAGGTYANSIFYDFNSAAIAIEDRTDNTEDDTYARLLAGDLTLQNNYFFNFGRGTGTAADIFVAIDQGGAIVPASSAEFVSRLVAAGNVVADPEFNNDDRDGGAFDPRPSAFSPAANAGSSFAIAGYDTTNYVGAFAPGNGDENGNWLMGWSAITETGAVFDFLNGVGQITTNGMALDAPAPNPASDLTTINYELPRRAEVTISILDVLGRNQGQFTTTALGGSNSFPVDVSNLPNGTYVVLLEAAGGRLAQKLVVRR
ncbi:T9SS type A sorting domain-containing protein [Neolewinella antarctica]|uniref:Secretion system C-terminal sorting domain-containing protein n=1 Tax=Neolewinella antarctica TaxID=442734 RepID=A0ABX0XAR7_9BACT|nr:T9SS type A sorting domain-containing protein [Neolewinella antarctica]NJC26351.1 hypothetical protein [Neolewinella antarctica]